MTNPRLVAESAVDDTRVIGRRVLTYASLASTNDRATELAIAGTASGTVVVAREQTAGRGQFGRSWHSPAGLGLLMSVVLRPPSNLLAPTVLTAWVAVSMAEAIRTVINRQASIKWPNDIMIRGKKVAGILVERGSATIVGLGLNLNQAQADFDRAQLPNASSLRLFNNAPVDVDRMTRAVIHRLDDEYCRLVDGEVATLESCWAWRTGLLGRTVAVELLNGDVLQGRLVDQRFDAVVITLGDKQVVDIRPERIRQLSLVGSRSQS